VERASGRAVHLSYTCKYGFREANNYRDMEKLKNPSNPFVEQQRHANQEYGSLKWKVA
jgi:hypothetical protein